MNRLLAAVSPANLFSLFFPQLCAACERDLRSGETVLCTYCIVRLPYTGHLLASGNPLERLFYGKAKISAAAAFYHFHKGGRTQQLAHLLKYGGRQDVGFFIGTQLGNALLDARRFRVIDHVIPVPLHPSRLRKRGYNQAACISSGICAVTGWAHFPEGLERVRASSTQTLKHRYERFTNVDGIFSVKEPEQHIGKRILLVDDVVTTGSTLVACAEVLLSIPGAEVFPVAMAAAG